MYAPVSSSDQKPDLDHQVARVVTRATEHGCSVDHVAIQVGSAFNGDRCKFLSLLEDPKIDMILAEHRDRFCRVGAEYVEAALEAQSRNWLR